MKFQIQKLLITISLLVSNSLSEKKLILVTTLIKSGAMTPHKTFMKSENPPWIEKYGLGEITAVGKRQALILGRKISKEYPSIITDDILPKDIYAYSTGMNRTFITAQSFLKGLLLNRKLEIPYDEKDERYRPYFKIDEKNYVLGSKEAIPNGPSMVGIDSRIPEKDTMMNLNTKIFCPNRDQDEDIKEYERIENLTKSVYKEKVEKVIKEYELDLENPESLYTCHNAGDFLISNYYNNPDVTIYKPGNPVYDTLKRCTNANYMAAWGSDRSMLIGGAPLIIEILSTINSKVSTETGGGGSAFRQRFVLYSGHRSNIEGVLKILGIFDRECIIKELIDDKDDENCLTVDGYLDNLIFETWLDTETKLATLKLRFRGRYLNFCEDKEGNKQTECDFKTLYYFTNQMPDVKNWQSYCGIVEAKEPEEEDYSFNFIIPLIICAGILILTLFILLCLMKKFNNVRMKRRLRLQDNFDDYLNVNATNEEEEEEKENESERSEEPLPLIESSKRYDVTNTDDNSYVIRSMSFNSVGIGSLARNISSSKEDDIAGFNQDKIDE